MFVQGVGRPKGCRDLAGTCGPNMQNYLVLLLLIGTAADPVDVEQPDAFKGLFGETDDANSDNDMLWEEIPEREQVGGLPEVGAKKDVKNDDDWPEVGRGLVNPWNSGPVQKWFQGATMLPEVGVGGTKPQGSGHKKNGFACDRPTRWERNAQLDVHL